MDDREKAAHGLVEDLQIAQASAQLAFHLREMIAHRSPLVLLADDFVWLSLRACRDTAVVHLWKVYDTQRDAHSLPWFIRRFSLATKGERDRDLARLSPKCDDVRRLRQLRHKVFAHRGSASRQEVDRILDKNNLSEAEFSVLTRDAQRILRTHFGAPLPRQLAHDSRDAIEQLIDLDVYLSDAYRGLFGIERFDLHREWIP